MKLIYTKSKKLVCVGDKVVLDGAEFEVAYFRAPHKPEASGKVTIRPVGSDHNTCLEYYVGIIGAEWIEREDRDAQVIEELDKTFLENKDLYELQTKEEIRAKLDALNPVVKEARKLEKKMKAGKATKEEMREFLNSLESALNTLEKEVGN